MEKQICPLNLSTQTTHMLIINQSQGESPSHLQVIPVQTKELQWWKLLGQVADLLFLSSSLLCLQLFCCTSQQEDLE